MNTTQGTLLEQLRDGRAGMAWEEFYHRYGRGIFALARSRGCSEHTAEEVVQDVMLVLFEERDVFRYDPQRGRFRDWLAAVVRNAVATRRRRPAERIRGEGGGEVDEPVSDEPSVEDAWEASFEHTLLAAILDVVRQEVKPETYQAFELTAIAGMPGDRVAEITGLSRNGVYLARRRVLQRLRELGATYRRDGQLTERLREALRSLPDDQLHASLSTRLARTLMR